MRAVCLPIVLVLTVLYGSVSFIYSQEETTNDQALWFEGEAYQFRSASNNPNALLNLYVPKSPNANGPGKRMMLVAFPRLGNCIEYVQYLRNQLRQNQPNAFFAIMPDSNPDRAICAMLTSTNGGNTHMIEVWHYYKPNPKWKAVLGIQFAVLAQGDQGRSFLEKQLEEKLKTWGEEMLNLKIPLPRFPFKEEAVGDKSMLGGFVQVEGFKAGRSVKVDADFAKQLGASEPPKAPFQVLVPFGSENLKINGAPNVPETAIFAVTTDDNMFIEAIRYTTLYHDAVPDTKKSLLALSWILEADMGESMLTKYGARIVDRYQTRVAEYDAAVILAESSNAEGPNYYIKFVAIPQPNATEGLAAVIMIDKDKAEDVRSLADTASKGFAAKILHSTQFLDSQPAAD